MTHTETTNPSDVKGSKPGSAVRHSAAAILLGFLLLIILTPLAQFLTMGALNSDMETASPAGWAVGLIFSFVLVAAVVRGLAKSRMLTRPNLVILYCMLTIGVPMMNIGLVRTVFQSLYAAIGEFMVNGNSTYRTAYSAQDPDWFPVVPEADALTWNKADRLLRLLRDGTVANERAAAQRRLVSSLAKPAPDPSTLLDDVSKLGPDEVTAVRTVVAAGVLTKALESRGSVVAARSVEAVEWLSVQLADVDELEASLLPGNLANQDHSSRNRLERELTRLTAEGRLALEQRVVRLQAREADLRRRVTDLSREDFARTRANLANRLKETYATLDEQALNGIRASFVYRLTRADRQGIAAQNGRDGAPNSNLSAFQKSLWSDQSAVQARGRSTLGENLRAVFSELPWRLWVGPLMLWGGLCAVIFGLMLVLADYLRHKWIERENLAFPLVEVADFLIRHDSHLETADDVLNPDRRATTFNPLWWFGFAAGLVWISAEALGHYGFTGSPAVVFFDVSRDVFAQNPALREMTNVCFVISPIVLGVTFLVSLEISFSVWVTFFALNFVAMLCRMANPNIADPLYVGYGGGRAFPFWMEQFLGACLCYGGIMLAKSLGNRERSRHWMVAGVLGLAGVGLLWTYGMTNLAFLGLVVFFMVAQAIAAARVRAETGLLTQHVSYEFTKLPMVFGMSGWIGADMYVRFISLACLPVTLLTRVLPQQLENFELGRRHQVPARTITVGAIVAFVTAVVMGMSSFLFFSYFWGEGFNGGSLPGQGGAGGAMSIARYPLWVSHFFGEAGLDRFTEVHWIRVGFMVAGALIVGLLTFLRQRFLRFPLHPIGYMVILGSIYYEFVSPYYKGDGTVRETSLLWGSVFIAWLAKKLIVKYGGMNLYKRAKPLFLGLVVGAVVTVFAWNMTDFVCSAVAQNNGRHRLQSGEFVKRFIEKPAFSPRFY